MPWRPQNFDRFAFLFNQYKKLSGITSEAPSHLLECLGTEVMAILYNTYVATITDQTEGQPITNIRRLVVKQRNTMATVMQVLRMYQDSDQAVLNFIAQLKAAARLCQFTAQCECSKVVEFTDMIMLYKLVAGIVDEELQKELLTKADRTLAEAEKMAVAAESAKDSMVSIHSEMGVLKVAKQNQQQLSSFDQRWVDWRPHLAQILSNSLWGSKINRKCAKLVLLLSVSDKNMEQFAVIEAVQFTEIFESVQKLGNEEFEMPRLQPYNYKYLHCKYVMAIVTGGNVMEEEPE